MAVITVNSMKPKFLPVLEMCIENGLTYGYRRAFKHNDNPTEEQITDQIRNPLCMNCTSGLIWSLSMKITIEDRMLAKYQAEQMRLREREDTAYRQKVEAKAFEQIIVDRVRRNLRLGLDKGTNVDLDA